jgi:hypothetical protein
MLVRNSLREDDPPRRFHPLFIFLSIFFSLVVRARTLYDAPFPLFHHSNNYYHSKKLLSFQEPSFYASHTPYTFSYGLRGSVPPWVSLWALALQRPSPFSASTLAETTLSHHSYSPLSDTSHTCQCVLLVLPLLGRVLGIHGGTRVVVVVAVISTLLLHVTKHHHISFMVHNPCIPTTAQT